MTRTLDDATLARLRQQVGFTPGDPKIDPLTNKPHRVRRAPTPRHAPKAPVPVPPSEPYFGDRNTARSQESARRDVEAAQRAFDTGMPLTDAQYAILRARIEHPYDSIGEIGERVGRSKDSVAGVLRQVRRKLSSPA